MPSNPMGGNEAYQELDRLEREWLKGHPKCDVCGYQHPPMKFFDRLDDLKGGDA